MDVRVGDISADEKEHPCGGKRIFSAAFGMDFRIRCKKCGREVMVPRVKVERTLKNCERTK